MRRIKDISIKFSYDLKIKGPEIMLFSGGFGWSGRHLGDNTHGGFFV
jgi:hypothetical protein